MRLLSRFHRGKVFLLLALLLVLGFQAHAQGFDIGLDGNTPYPDSARSRLAALLEEGGDRPLTAGQLDEFKAILTSHGWPTYRTSGPEVIETCAALLRRSGADFPFQQYMLRLLDQQVGDDIRPEAYARFADQAYAGHEGVQLYGTLHRREGADYVAHPPIRSEGAMLFFRDFYGLPGLDEELAALAAGAATPGYDGPMSQPSATYTRPDIRRLLGELIQPDQSLRMELQQARAGGDAARVEALQARIAEADRESLPQLRAVFDEVGFPTREMVGIDGVSTAFLLVQHADEDPAFQQRALELAEPLMRSRGMSRRQYAMLADRVALAAGRPQLYGTQMQLENGRYVLQPTADLENLDQRRREMALGPYRQMLQSANAAD